MKILYLFACLVRLSLNYTLDAMAKCACSDVSDTATCTTYGCKWDGSSCMDKVCTDYTSQSSCDGSKDCAWNNSEACAAFTACADYAVTTANDCTGKGNSSTACDSNATAGTDGKFVCKTSTPIYVTCSTLAQAACYGMESTDKACAWKAAASAPSCVALTMTSCPDANNFSQSVCETTFFCMWLESTKTCKLKECSDGTNDNTCRAVGPVFGVMTAILCEWDGAKCIEAADTSKLTVATCSTHTGFTHTWNTSSSTCDSCSSYAGVLAFAVGLSLWLA